MDYDTSICSQWAPTEVFFSGIKKSKNFHHLISLSKQESTLESATALGSIVKRL